MKKGHFKAGAKADSIRQRRYNSSRLQKHRRAIRNEARRKAMKAGRVHKGDWRDVDHKDRRGLSYSSTQVLSVHKNRGKNAPLFSGKRKKQHSVRAGRK